MWASSWREASVALLGQPAELIANGMTFIPYGQLRCPAKRWAGTLVSRLGLLLARLRRALQPGDIQSLGREACEQGVIRGRFDLRRA